MREAPPLLFWGLFPEQPCLVAGGQAASSVVRQHPCCPWVPGMTSEVQTNEVYTAGCPQVPDGHAAWTPRDGWLRLCGLTPLSAVL